MKTSLGTMCFFIIITALLDTSCIIPRRYPTVTPEQVLKIQPFKATVEKIDIYTQLLFEHDVDLWLRMDDGRLTCLSFAPANKKIIDFAHTLREGQYYCFPKVFADYLNNQTVGNP